MEPKPQPRDNHQQLIAQHLRDDGTAGPRPITLAEYRRCNRNQPTGAPREEPANIGRLRRPRAGRAVRLRKEKAELYRIINITRDKDLKNNLIKKLHQLYAMHPKRDHPYSQQQQQHRTTQDQQHQAGTSKGTYGLGKAKRGINDNKKQYN